MSNEADSCSFDDLTPSDKELLLDVVQHFFGSEIDDPETFLHQLYAQSEPERSQSYLANMALCERMLEPPPKEVQQLIDEITLENARVVFAHYDEVKRKTGRYPRICPPVHITDEELDCRDVRQEP